MHDGQLPLELLFHEFLVHWIVSNLRTSFSFSGQKLTEGMQASDIFLSPRVFAIWWMNIQCFAYILLLLPPFYHMKIELIKIFHTRNFFIAFEMNKHLRRNSIIMKGQSGCSVKHVKKKSYKKYSDRSDKLFRTQITGKLSAHFN